MSQRIRVLQQLGEELEQMVERATQTHDAPMPGARPRETRWARPANSGPVLSAIAVLVAAAMAVGAIAVLGRAHHRNLGTSGGSGAIASLAPLEHTERRTVAVPIGSFVDPAPLALALRNAGVPALVQLLPIGKDCSTPPIFTPLPRSELPAFNPEKNPHANPPIDFWGHAQRVTLILHTIPKHATLVVESMPQSMRLLERWPIAEKGAALSTGFGRGIYVQWAEGQVKPCKVVTASR